VVRRVAALVVGVLVVSLVVVGAGFGRPAHRSSVRCSEIIGHDLPGSYRQVLARAAVPAVFLANVGSEPSSAPFSFWTKAGIVIRAGAAVTVTVAPAVARRVRITWGGASGTSLRFGGCREGAPWNDYAGGFLARTATVCVPLILSANGQQRTLRFGLGRRCPR
jgi:hypothetical protein